MKKIMVFAAAAIFAIAPALAQTSVKVDKDEHLKKIAKSDTDIANPKKNAKPAVWLERGKVFTEAGSAATTGLFKSLDEASVRLLFGANPETSTETIGNVEYQVFVYPHVKLYMNGGVVAFWQTTLEVVDNAFNTAYEAFSKAYEVDQRSSEKVREGIITLSNELKKNAENNFSLRNFIPSANDFAKAYEIQLHPTVNMIDTMSVFNAGMIYCFGDDFLNGEKYLRKSLELGYDNEGDAYYYLYYAYYGMKQNQKAIDILQEGIAKYPGNTRIVEGLISIYSLTEGTNPADIITIVEKSIQNDPENPYLWDGLGGINIKLKNYDKAIEAYSKAVELAPEEYIFSFRLGYALLLAGDNLVDELNAANITSSAEYNERLENANNEYQKALAPLERAFELNPTDPVTIEFLKNLTFRLRDRDGIMDKYNKYNELFKALPPR